MIPPYSLHWNNCYFPSYPSYLTLYNKSDLDNTVKYINTDIKSYLRANNNSITAINDNIADILVTLVDANNKQNKQKEKITEISSKLSTYEDQLEKWASK